MLGRRRPLARAAIVGGAAYAAGSHHQKGKQAEYEQDARLAQLEDQQTQQQYAPPPPPPPQYAPPPPPAPAAPAIDLVGELEKLASLKDKGILTEAEFEVQKHKLLQQS